MKLKMMSVFDVKVGVFAAPFMARTLGEAIRSFTDACSDDSLPFKKHPEDYQLYDLGDFDDSQGKLETIGPQRVIGASEIVPEGGA